MNISCSIYKRRYSGLMDGRFSRVLFSILRIAILSICPWSVVCAQISTYYPFPDSNAVWGMRSSCTDWNCGTYRYVQNYYRGDTIIDGNLYKAINEEASVDFESCGCDIPETLGAGYMRYDTAARKVYWRIPGMGSDSLLYDFTLEIGDTLRGLYGNSGLCSGTIFTVQSIDSVQVGTSYRKRINFSNVDFEPCNSTSIIEGVGSTTGLTACYTTPASFGIKLACFTVNSELLYTAPCGAPNLVACGELPLGIAATGRSKRAYVAALPNPSTGLFTLSSPTLNSTGYTSTGQELFQSTGQAIDLCAYPPGLYHAVVRTAQGVGHVRLLAVR